MRPASETMSMLIPASAIERTKAHAHATFVAAGTDGSDTGGGLLIGRVVEQAAKRLPRVRGLADGSESDV